jgi:hypothetical protein
MSSAPPRIVVAHAQRALTELVLDVAGCGADAALFQSRG